MTWAVWWPLFGAAIAGTVLAMSFYFHWSFRYARKGLGLTAEVSAMLLIICLGAAAVTHLLSHFPK